MIIPLRVEDPTSKDLATSPTNVGLYKFDTAKSLERVQAANPCAESLHMAGDFAFKESSRKGRMLIREYYSQNDEKCFAQFSREEQT